MATAVYNPRPTTLFASSFHSVLDRGEPRYSACITPNPIHTATPTHQSSKRHQQEYFAGNMAIDPFNDRVTEGVSFSERYDGREDGPEILPVRDIYGSSISRRQASASEGSTKCQRYVAKLEDFQLIRVLGKGCAGRVLLVKHTSTNGIHAMKAISKRSVLTHDELVHTLAEVSILRRIATQEPSNRFVSKLHYSFTDRENFYFVMEFYPGGDLATQMEIYGILGDHRTRFYAADITQGLEDLHRHGIIVRDLKPENILLNSKGHAVLADFGLSKEFPYRGDPKPIHVVTYPGQEPLPPWAGKGAGSYRNLDGSGEKLVVDKAYSFVGTSEYLSPEVVKRGEYSYAVDWWALGCIVLEGLIGRVPFRKAEDDPPMMLWNKILYGNWDECLREPKLARFAPDQLTFNFIEGLLQKNPMRRLTEPFVKQHEYFAMIDWPTVERGEYQDPHGLHIHPTAEYNTRYFPKLCLEEEPNVDMSTHDLRDYDTGGKKTPMNDNALYKLELAKFRKELEGFTWSREEWEEESEVESASGIGDSIMEDSEHSVEGEGSVELGGFEEGVFELRVVNKDIESPESIAEDVSLEEKLGSVSPTTSPRTSPVHTESTTLSPSVLDMPTRLSPEMEPALEQSETLEMQPVPSGEAEDLDLYRTHSPEPDSQEDNIQTETVEQKSEESMDDEVDEKVGKETVVASKVEEGIDLSAKVDVQEDDDFDDARVEPPSKELVDESKTPRLSLKPLPPILSDDSDDIPPVPAPPPVPPRRNPSLAQPIRIPQPLGSALKPSSNPVHVPEPNLAVTNDLPSSGLSSSDIVSIQPVPGGHASPRLIRRHLRTESEDATPLARLSLELHGTITRLEDEDWEELGMDKEGIPTAPNGVAGGPSFFKSFATSALRRRPSTLATSSLRMQYGKGSDTSSRASSAASPTKSESRESQRKLFGASKGMESTKRALKGLKTFPRLMALSPSPERKDKTTTPLGSPPPSSFRPPFSKMTSDGNMVRRDRVSGDGADQRLGIARRHTESGWLERHLKRSRSSIAASQSTREEPRHDADILSDSEVVKAGGRISVVEGKGIAPRLELKEDDPVVWEF